VRTRRGTVAIPTALTLLFSMMAAGSSAQVKTYGFVGVGTMSSAIVRGMCTLPEPLGSVVLSPRGAEKAGALASEFPSAVRVAKSNQEVLDASDVVFIGVLPKQTEGVLRELKFEARHTVVSLVSTTPFSTLHEACAPVPAAQIVRAIPLPPVAKHRGVCVMAPKHAVISSLFDRLGTVVAVETEAQMKKLLPITCLMGQFYAQQRATQHWLEAQGIEPEVAAKWTGAVFHCARAEPTHRPTTARAHRTHVLLRECPQPVLGFPALIAHLHLPLQASRTTRPCPTSTHLMSWLLSRRPAASMSRSSVR
jgi:pyrroline-5-carboxylate reductase